MVGLSASWNVSGPQSGRAVISSDWLTEVKSFPAFLVCSLIAICTCAARPPTMNSHLSFSISSLVRWAPTAGLSWSSRNRISSLRPRIPPLALISSIATLAPCCWSLARAPKGPVVGPGKPTLIVSPPCALRIAGKAATAAPAAVVARNARRFIGRLLGESGADHRGGPLACQTQPGRAGRSHFAPTAGHPRSAPAPRAQLQISRARLPRVRHVGSRAKRPDDPRILTGRGRYVDDLILPRMVHVAFVRSVHAHARLGRVGVGAARRAPDVVGVLTGAEAARLCKPYRGVLAHYRGMKTGAMQPLAVERVRYVGEPIVAVAATSRAAAEDAARRVAVEYEPLPAVLDPRTALAPGAPLIHEALGDHLIYETRLIAGDVAGALAAAHRVYTLEVTIGRHTGVPVEPRSLVADYEPATRALTLWISSQVHDSGSYHAALETLLEAAGYDALRGEQRAARAAGRAVGIGLSCFVELPGPGAQFYGVGGAPISGQEGTTVRLAPSGAVTVLTGVTDQGQGTRTALAQIVVDELGVPLEAVAVLSGDTGVVPSGGGTGASRGMPIGGSATLLAVRALRDRVRRVAAALLEAHEGDIELAEGRVHVRGSPDRALTLRQLATTVWFRSNELRGVEPSLEATIHYTNPGAWTFTNGAHLAVVEVDTETGRVRVLKYVAVDDCGRLVNPALVDGQVRGGVAQGIGGALWEHCVYDDAGQLLTATLMDYAVPNAADLSPIEVHHLETPAPSIAGGYKGAGEGGTARAPAAIPNAG